MNREETATCYGIVCAAYGIDSDPATLRAWHLLMADEIPDGYGVKATKKLCQSDSPYPPRPGQIIAEAHRLDGTKAPALDAATGLYLSGDWDRHPAIRAAAERVYWDRRTAPEEARWQFRSLYAAQLHDEDMGITRPDRQALTEGPQRITPELEAGS